MKFYADGFGRFVRQVASDLVVFVWTALGIRLGMEVHAQILRLQVIGDALKETGRTFNGWIADFGAALPGQSLPIIGSSLTDYLKRLSSSLKSQSGDPLISHGNQINDLIASLAFYFGICTAVLALLLVTVPYVAFRIAGAREMGAAQAFVESARTGGRVREAEALLAFRALATLRFTRIMRVSADPVGDLTSGNYERLADAMMGRMGLNTRRLYGASRPPRLNAPHRRKSLE